MGFFSRKEKDKDRDRDKAKVKYPKLEPSNPFNPPNIYIEANTYPPIPSRPKTAAPSSRDADKDRRSRRTRHTHHENTSTPQLQLTAAPHHQPASSHPSPPSQQIQHHNYGPLIVNQHYYLNAPPPQDGPSPYLAGGLGGFTGSVANLAKEFTNVPKRNDGLGAWYGYSTQVFGSTISTFDEISYRLNNVLTMIDNGGLAGHEMDLFACRQPTRVEQESKEVIKSGKKGSKDRDREKSAKSNVQPCDVAASVVRGDYFSKVELYANSKLPKDLPPFAVYFPTWPLLTLAAQYSSAVYEKPPASSEREAHISADWLSATKAMTIKSLPMDSMHTIVFAIRGTASFMDWAVNLNAQPTSPKGFLDDEGNLCHSGFLSVARRTLRPVASRLKELLREDPGRARYSLLITGHSAGGAVASLLYSHMLSRSEATRSELNILTSRFKRVHCVTFGTPPISLLPLMKPDRPELKNSVFLSFVNEGDPVVRADKAYVKSLLELLASPAPEPIPSSHAPRTKSRGDLKSKSSKSKPSSSSSSSSSYKKPTWPIPTCSLSSAGRIVVLRSASSSSSNSSTPKRQDKDRMTIRERLAEGVVANVCREDQLRGVIWGDPAAHMMTLYAGRIDMLAVDAVKPRKR